MRHALAWLALWLTLIPVYFLLPWPAGGLHGLLYRREQAAKCPPNILAVCAIDVGTPLLLASIVASVLTCTLLFMLAQIIAYRRTA